MSLTTDNYIQIITITIASFGFVLGYFQYKKGQHWKQSEFASKEIEKLFSNEILVLACQMLDWEYGKSKIPIKFKGTRNNKNDFEYSWTMYKRAMHNSIEGPDGNGYNENERYCRVIFDDLFTFLDLLNHYVSVKLIKIEDIKPVEYWVNQIFRSELAGNKDLFTPYLKKFGYAGVIELDKKFKRAKRGKVINRDPLEFLKKFFLNSFVFILWGAFLMFLYKFVGDGLKKEINEMYLESITPKSMMYLLIFEFFLVGTFLLIFGANTGERNRVRKFFYDNTVIPVSEFARSFSSVSFGMIVGFAIVVRIFGFVKPSIVLALIAILILICGLLSWGMMTLPNENQNEKMTNRKTRIFGAIFILTSFIMFFFSLNFIE